MPPRPRYWTEWEAYSKARPDQAVLVYQHNRIGRAARHRECYREGSIDWPSECIWYYLNGVRYTVLIHWYKVTVTKDHSEDYQKMEYLQESDIPRNIAKVVSKIRGVLGEKLTQTDRDRWAEHEAWMSSLFSRYESQQGKSERTP